MLLSVRFKTEVKKRLAETTNHIVRTCVPSKGQAAKLRLAEKETNIVDEDRV